MIYFVIYLVHKPFRKLFRKLCEMLQYIATFKPLQSPSIWSWFVFDAGVRVETCRFQEPVDAVVPIERLIASFRSLDVFEANWSFSILPAVANKHRPGFFKNPRILYTQANQRCWACEWLCEGEAWPQLFIIEEWVQSPRPFHNLPHSRQQKYQANLRTGTETWQRSASQYPNYCHFHGLSTNEKGRKFHHTKAKTYSSSPGA